MSNCSRGPDGPVGDCRPVWVYAGSQEDQAMAAVDLPVVIAVYPGRVEADELVALLRAHRISVVAVPSDRHVGEWEVMVSARDASRAIKMVQDLLNLD